MGVTFIVYNEGGAGEQYPTYYNENYEEEVDMAWNEVRERFPKAEYIERLEIC